MAKPSRPLALMIPAPPDDLCLRFVNTRYWRGSDAPTETLAEPAHLAAWLTSEAGLTGSATDAVDAAALRDALNTREFLFRLFTAASLCQPGNPADIDALNAALAAAPARTEIGLAPGLRGWLLRGTPPARHTLLAPVLWSAGDLLLGPRAQRVRQCANPACAWTFLDDSKSGNRRWCAMSACGNRAKAQRHYARLKTRAAADTG